MTNGTELQGRLVASRLIRFDNHPWGWTPITDVAEMLGRTPACVWEDYCFDARTAALADDWSGQSWVFALPAVLWDEVFLGEAKPQIDANTKYQVKEVWNMRTGERAPVLGFQTDYVLLPAGWSRNRKQETQRLEATVRQALAIAKSGSRSVSGLVDVELAHADLAAAIQAVGTVDNLNLVLGQIASAADAVWIERSEAPQENAIRLKIKEHENGCLPTLSLEVRMVLGCVKLAHVSAYYY